MPDYKKARKLKGFFLLTSILYLGIQQKAFAAADIFSLIDNSFVEATGSAPARGMFRIPGRGIQPLDARVENLGYYPSDIPVGGLEAIVTPYCRSDTLPVNINLGQSRQRRRYTCTYEGINHSREDFFGGSRPNRGSWVHTFDQNRQVTTAELILKIADRGREENVQYRSDADKIRISMPDTPGAIIGAEVQGAHRYAGGNAVSLTRYRTQEFTNPVSGATYRINVFTAMSSIPTHAGRDIVYVNPFSLPGQRRAESAADYQGTYESLGETLAPAERGANANISDGAIIYVTHEVNTTGGREQAIYNTRITHEKWRKDAWEAGFSIVSKKDGEKLFSRGDIDAIGLEEGTYQLQHVREIILPDGEKKHLETWKKLDSDGDRFIEIKTSRHTTFIPGLKAKSFKVEEGASDVDKMRTRLTNTQRVLQDGTERYRNRDSLYIIGKSAIGKTIFINALAGRELEAYEEADIIKVRPRDPLPNSDIGRGDGEAGTKSPTPYLLEDRRLVVWDCPGFQDPGGTSFDIVNSINIQRAIKAAGAGRARFGLAIEETQFGANGQEFLNYLNRMTEMVPNIATLRDSLFVLITKASHRDTWVFGKMGEYWRSQLPDTEGRYREGRFPLNPNALELLRYLHTEGRGKVISLPEAKEIGRFELMPGDGLWERIAGVPGHVNPDVRHVIHADPAAQLKISRLTTVLNASITKFLKTQWYSGIMDSCQDMVRQHTGSLAVLRAALTLKKNQLSVLRDGSTGLAGTEPVYGLNQLNEELGGLDPVRAEAWNTIETNILDRLNALSNVEPLKRDLDALRFLKMIKPDLVYSISHWRDALSQSINSIDRLLVVEELFSHDNTMLTLKGFLLGTSDLQRLLTPTLRTMNIYSANGMFIDENFTGPGVSLKIITPHWHVVGDRTIDLSGATGVPGIPGGDGHKPDGSGADGGPGSAGGNGGSFFGKGFTFSNIDSLTLRSNGGKGGDGGNGAEGKGGNDALAGTNPTQKISDSGGIYLLRYAGGGPLGIGIHTNCETRRVQLENKAVTLLDGRQTNLKDWIGSDWHNQISITGHATDYEDAPEGKVGKDGGQGGARGLGGRPGEVILQGATLAHSERTDGPAGDRDGVGGAGGAGGRHGQVLKRKMWENCRLREHADYPLPNIWIEGPRIEGPAIERAGGGVPQPGLVAAMPVVAATPADTDLVAFRAFYRIQAADPITSYLVKNFPGLL